MYKSVTGPFVLRLIALPSKCPAGPGRVFYEASKVCLLSVRYLDDIGEDTVVHLCFCPPGDGYLKLGPPGPVLKYGALWGAPGRRGAPLRRAGWCPTGKANEGDMMGLVVWGHEWFGTRQDKGHAG